MGKISTQKKDFEDIEACWETILFEIGKEGKDIEICSLQPRGETKYFHARKRRNKIIVDVAREHTKSSDISTERSIDLSEFECVAGLYNDYISGLKGIRSEMRDNCGQNSSYLISLIDRFL